MTTSCNKPGPEEALHLLDEGNRRFVEGRSTHPHADAARRGLAATSQQADYAYATVISCSDSRVPVEILFDAGIMDLFVVRVAGNVCNTDEIGCIEYGLAHVRTPLLVVLGHTQCGAVTAVTRVLQGHGHPLERNIPPLVRGIEPAVRRALESGATENEETVFRRAVEENVWEAIGNLFLASPRTRELVHGGQARVCGAIYELETGCVRWLDEARVAELLDAAERDPVRAVEPFAEE
ncbi:MAG TPA: carbonic anhydrase [Candidatus Hydrogenedentes bacterium]|nr:carbonic anhydrase [Candidatus Hydrogenedentota bacterium]HNT89963.1 carbonic anhydrase [Candidatus Hydrogenedentota bacterium]